MSTMTIAVTDDRYNWIVPCRDNIGHDLVVYGVAYEVDGQRIDPARVKVHTPLREQRTDTNLLHTPANSSPHIATGE